jgi:hypothetical protein
MTCAYSTAHPGLHPGGQTAPMKLVGQWPISRDRYETEHSRTTRAEKVRGGLIRRSVLRRHCPWFEKGLEAVGAIFSPNAGLLEATERRERFPGEVDQHPTGPMVSKRHGCR